MGMREYMERKRRLRDARKMTRKGDNRLAIVWDADERTARVMVYGKEHLFKLRQGQTLHELCDHIGDGLIHSGIANAAERMEFLESIHAQLVSGGYNWDDTN